MKLTNNFNLPQPIVQAIADDDYDRGNADISASSLWKPPRIVALEELHRDKLETDAIDNIWTLLGKAIHETLSKRDTEAVVEKRLFIECAGWTISGQFDRLVMLHGGIEDYKVTSAYVVRNLSRSHEWEEQLNTYAHILRKHGYEVKYLRVNAILRDWSKREAKRDKDYPQKQVAVIDLPLWSPEEAERRISERVRLHQEARKTLPLCTDEDRWLKPTRYAVMKDGRKTAVKVFDTEGDAVAFLSVQKDKGKMYVEPRPGTAIRCESYCYVGAAGLCSQWKDDPENPANSLLLKDNIE